MRDVFDAIKYRLYVPGAPPPPRISAPAIQPVAPRGPAQGNFGGPEIPRGPQNGSRKRSYNESGSGDFQGRGDYQPGADMNGRAFKQPRRGGIVGRGGRGDSFGNFRGDQQHQNMPMNTPGMPLSGFPNMPSISSPPPGMPPLDPNNPMATFLAMQAMGFPGMPPLPQGISPSSNAGPTSTFVQGQRPRRCRDYDTKGFCARGNSCKFEHGNDSIYVPPARADGKPPSFSLDYFLGCQNLRDCL